MKKATLCCIVGSFILLLHALIQDLKYGLFNEVITAYGGPIVLLVFSITFYKKLRPDIDDAFGFNDNPRDLTKFEKPECGLGDNNAEKVLVVFAYILLILGSLGCLICGIYLVDERDRYTEVLGLSIISRGILFCIVTWAFIMVLANISNNIRQIKYDQRKKLN